VSVRRTWTADARPLVAGSAAGIALVLDEPLSFWGGLDQQTGVIIDERHPQRGEDVSGRMLVMPGGRGSSSSSSVLAEAIRNEHGPAGLILAEVDEIIVLGALVVELLDGHTVPVVQLAEADYGALESGDHISIEPGGQLTVVRG
jgi:predicted aconitase with swiveling domain